MPGPTQEWRRALVYGLGVTGLAASRLLRSQEVEVVAMDRRRADELELAELLTDPGVKLMLGEEPQTLPPGIDGVVVSPGVPLNRPLLAAARAAELPVIAEVELGFTKLEGPVVAITGSNGKSTTTALTGHLLRAAGYQVEVCGNIGVPLSSRVGNGKDRIWVTELSSFQLEGIDTFRPRAAALLNLAPDHLDRYEDVESYFAAKLSLFRNQQSQDVAVLNADDPKVAAVEVRSRRRLFSRRRLVSDGCFLEGDSVVEAVPGEPPATLFRRQDLALPGEHNLENAMAAVLLSRAVGADPGLFPGALGTFRGLPHRVERVREHRGIVWVDDSKATNIAATLKSLEGFRDSSVHLILGGRYKGGDPESLASAVARKARRLYLVGEAAAEFHRALGDTVPCELVDDLDRAVTAAAAAAKAGDTVLLSPACASFDQYRDFGERGDHFQTLVRALDG